MIFTLKPMDPKTYRQQTRRSTLIVTVIFVVLAMGGAALFVALFGDASTEDNFKWNLMGVIAGVIVTSLIVRCVFWHQPWMQPAVYNWKLKRHLMQVTNVMHLVTDGIEKNQAAALNLMNFYQQGLLQMYELDGNTHEVDGLNRERRVLVEKMKENGLDSSSQSFDPEWVKILRAPSQL